MVLIFQELLGNANVLVGKLMVRKIPFNERRGSFMQPGCLKMFAFQRTIDGIFPLLAAALRANVAVDAGAGSACTPLFTQLTGSVHQRSSLAGDRAWSAVGPLLLLYRIIEKWRE
jgi:hypothetical protein